MAFELKMTKFPSFSKDQFRVALRIYSQDNYKQVKKCLRGGPVKRALALLIIAGNQM